MTPICLHLPDQRCKPFLQRFFAVQVPQVDHVDPQLHRPMAHWKPSLLCRNDGGARDLAAEAVAEDGKLVQGFGLYITGLAADEDGPDPSAVRSQTAGSGSG